MPTVPTPTYGDIEPGFAIENTGDEDIVTGQVFPVLLLEDGTTLLLENNQALLLEGV